MYRLLFLLSLLAIMTIPFLGEAHAQSSAGRGALVGGASTIVGAMAVVGFAPGMVAIMRLPVVIAADRRLIRIAAVIR